MRYTKLAAAILLPTVSGSALAAAHENKKDVNANPATEEVTVYARLREENVQDVPIAIDVFDSQTLFERGLYTFGDVARNNPSLVLDEGSAPQDLRISIRGLSPTRGRQNVAVLLDGIDISSEALVTAGGTLLIDPFLFDIQQVEVVKGPQNALYGRSAFAGAISYRTLLPDDEFRASVETDIGNYGRALARGRVSGPLIGDTLSGGLSAAVWQADGFYDNSTTGDDIGGRDGTTVAGTLVWKPDDTWSVVGRVSYQDSDYEIQPLVNPAPTVGFPLPTEALGTVIDPSVTSILGVNGPPPGADSLRPTNSPNPRTGRDYPGTDQDIFRSTLTVTKDFASTRFTSLTHFADTSSFQFQDFNAFGDINTLPASGELWIDNDTQLFSQDIRLESTGDGPVSWLVGALYWEENKDLKDGGVTCLTYAPPFVGFEDGPPCGPFIADVGTSLPRNPDRWSRDTEHWSVYGLVGWQFADNWDLTLEGRYVNEDLEVGGPDIDNSIIDPTGLFGPPSFSPAEAGVTKGTDDDSYFAPKATLSWSPTDRSLFYASVAQGIKPSGISTVTGGVGAFNPDDNDFEQEKVTVYEIGTKLDSPSQRVRFNGAFFYQDFTDKQVTSQLPDESGILRSRVLNADAEVYGLELDISWAVTDYLSVRGAYTWLDTEYTDFPQLTQSAGTIAYAGNCEVVTTSADQTTCRVSFTGNELERAPEHAFVGSARYQRGMTSELDWYIEGQGTYTDERYTNPANLLEFDSFWLFDLRAGLVAENWEIIGYVDNAFDDDTIRTGFNTGGYLLDFSIAGATFVLPDSGQFYLPPKRTYGVRASYRFGG